MKQVTATIEKGTPGFYSIYIENNPLGYGILGDGYSVEEAIEDFYMAYDEMKEYYRDINKPFTEAEFTFVYDTSCKWTKEELSVVPGMSMAMPMAAAL